MSAVWTTIAVLCAGTVAIKAAGPVAFGGRRLSPRTSSVITLVAPAILAALVVFETLGGDGDGMRLDARVVGLAAAGLALAARLPLVVVVVAAAAATALARAVS